MGSVYSHSLSPFIPPSHPPSLSPSLPPSLPPTLPPSILARFNHTVTRAQSSWAGMMDVHSLRDIPAPQFPSGTVELPPKSIFLATYDNQKMPQTPKKKKEYLTIYPEDSSTIMVPIRSATFEISVDFVIPSSILKQSYVVTLQFGSLGPPSHAVWTGVVDCYKNGTKFVSIIYIVMTSFSLCVCVCVCWGGVGRETLV